MNDDVTGTRGDSTPLAALYGRSAGKASPACYTPRRRGSSPPVTVSAGTAGELAAKITGHEAESAEAESGDGAR